MAPPCAISSTLVFFIDKFVSKQSQNSRIEQRTAYRIAKAPQAATRCGGNLHYRYYLPACGICLPYSAGQYPCSQPYDHRAGRTATGLYQTDTVTPSKYPAGS